MDRKNRLKRTYPDLDSAERDILHSEEIPTPSLSSLPTLSKGDTEPSTFDEV